MNGLLKGFPSAESLAGTKGAMEALPAIMDALGRIPATLRAMPPAPVILGAASRVIATAIGNELEARGPSARFMAVCAGAGIDETAALALHSAIVDEIRS